MSTLTPFDLAALALAGIASLGLLLALGLAWLRCGKPPAHNRDDASYKQGV